MDEKERFLSHVEKTETCWLWERTVESNGYGSFRNNGKRIRAHRAAYILFTGTIPAGMCVCHLCDVKNCVNPDHLWIGTNQDNMKDMANKGRAASGIRNGAPRKLSIGAVMEIRESGLKQEELAKKFDVTQTCISHIKLRKRWRWV